LQSLMVQLLGDGMVQFCWQDPEPGPHALAWDV
jgi:hypothetical protein